MTHSEAEHECQRLTAEHPDRRTHQWHPRQGADGLWSVVKIALPPAEADTQAELRADEKPPTADDPRPALDRNVGSPWAAGL